MRVEWNYFQWEITILIFVVIVNGTLSCLWSALTSEGPPSVQVPQLVVLPFGDEELLLDPLRGLLWSPDISFCCHVDWNDVKCKESPVWWQSLSRTWRPLPVSPVRVNFKSEIWTFHKANIKVDLVIKLTSFLVISSLWKVTKAKFLGSSFFALSTGRITWNMTYILKSTTKGLFRDKASRRYKQYKISINTSTTVPNCSKCVRMSSSVQP